MSSTLALIMKGVANNPAKFAYLCSLADSLDCLIWADMACASMAPAPFSPLYISVSLYRQSYHHARSKPIPCAASSCVRASLILP